MKRFTFIFMIILSFLFLPISLVLGEDIPKMINYQGYVEDNSGVPIDGNGYFKFAIINKEGETVTVLWSNAIMNENQPENAVTIPVTNGVFTTKLGDIGNTNMASLSDIPFEQQNIFIRVWFSEDGTNFELLSPDTQILSTGFAFKAQMLAGGEIDPKIGTLEDGKWCKTDGLSVNCTSNLPDLNETDPTVDDSVKDGVSWSEIKGIPDDIKDGDDKGGDITGVTAGTGLNGGGNSGDVTINADTSYLQRRVSGTCPAGQSIRVINNDGTVVCEVDDFFSDKRLKNIHGNYEHGLNEIEAITPIRYNFKEDNALGIPSDQEIIGLSAQEVMEVIPEAVSEGAEGYLRLNSDPVIWAMLNAIKELNKENKLLKERISALESQLSK